MVKSINSRHIVPYHTRLKRETKDLMGALAFVLRLKGQRELIERLLTVYGEHYPQDIVKANELQAMINSIELPDDPDPEATLVQNAT